MVSPVLLPAFPACLNLYLKVLQGNENTLASLLSHPGRGIICSRSQSLRQELRDELTLHVWEVKGQKERLIPIGELDWCLAVGDKWLEAA
jgi:hypothetical protein